MQFVSLISGLHSSDAEQSAEDLRLANDELSHLRALLEGSVLKSDIEGMVPKAHYDQAREEVELKGVEIERLKKLMEGMVSKNEFEKRCEETSNSV